MYLRVAKDGWHGTAHTHTRGDGSSRPEACDATGCSQESAQRRAGVRAGAASALELLPRLDEPKVGDDATPRVGQPARVWAAVAAALQLRLAVEHLRRRRGGEVHTSVREGTHHCAVGLAVLKSTSAAVTMTRCR